MNVWRERLDRWFRPIAERSPLSPNQITILGAVLNVTAAITMAFASRDPRLFLIVPVLLTVGGLLDALDGLVARVQNSSSRFGDFLDHFLDRVSDLSIMAGWIVGAGVRAELGFPVFVAIALNGYVGTQVEATFGERSYEGVGRGEYFLAMVALPCIAYTLDSADQLRVSYGGCSILEWLTIAMALGALAGVATRVRLAKELSDRG